MIKKNSYHAKATLLVSFIFLHHSFIMSMNSRKTINDAVYSQIVNINQIKNENGITYTALLPNNRSIYAHYFTKGAGRGTCQCYLVEVDKEPIMLNSSAFDTLHTLYSKHKK